MNKSPIIWYAGVCDRILAELNKWYSVYPMGPVVREEVSQLNWRVEGGQTRIPTVRRIYISLKEIEIDHMIRIIGALRPEDKKYARLIAMLEKTKPILRTSRLMPGGFHWTPMDFRRSDVKDIILIMKEAKTGKRQKSLEDWFSKQSKGKGAWE
jgi:hypothetical protein